MNISVENLPQCKVRISAEISADFVAENRQRIVSSFMREAKIPGFRPGKTPKKMIEKRFADSITNELKDRLTRAALQEAAERESFSILAVAEIERDQLESDGSFLLAAEIIRKPEIELPDYKGIPVEVEVYSVTDEDVEHRVDEIRQRLSKLRSVEHPIQAGDVVSIAYVGTIDGEALSAEEFFSLAGSAHAPLIIPVEDGSRPVEPVTGMAASAIGHSKGEKITFSKTFVDEDKEQHSEALQEKISELIGKTVDYEIVIKDVSEYISPELDDSLAQLVGVESLDKLRELIRAQYEMNLAQRRQNEIDSKILTYLAENTNFDLPENLVFSETQARFNDLVYEGYSQGVSTEQISEHQDEIVKAAEHSARVGVRNRLILDKIVTQEKITSTEREVIEEIFQIAEQQKRPPKKVANEMFKEGRIPSIHSSIRTSKALALLRDLAEITEIPATQSEESDETPVNSPAPTTSDDTAETSDTSPAEE